VHALEAVEDALMEVSTDQDLDEYFGHEGYFDDSSLTRLIEDDIDLPWIEKRWCSRSPITRIRQLSSWLSKRIGWRSKVLA